MNRNSIFVGSYSAEERPCRQIEIRGNYDHHPLRRASGNFSIFVDKTSCSRKKKHENV